MSKISRTITFVEVQSKTFILGENEPRENEPVIFLGKTNTKKIKAKIEKVYSKENNETTVITKIEEKTEKRTMSLDSFIKNSEVENNE